MIVLLNVLFDFSWHNFNEEKNLDLYTLLVSIK